MLAVGSADPFTFDAFVHILFTPPDKYDYGLIEKLKLKWENTVAVLLVDQLSKTPYLTGNNFTLADITMVFILLTSERMGWHEKYPAINKYVERVRKRDAFKKTFPMPLEPINLPVNKKLPNLSVSQSQITVDPEPPLSNGIPQINLYHIPRTRSTRVLWLINEIGGEVKANTNVSMIEWDFLKSKEYFAVNPNQLVPAVTINGHHMFEAGAIVRFITEKLSPHYETTKKLFPNTWTEANWSRHFVYSYWTIIHLDKEILSNFFGLSRITGKISGNVPKWWKKVVYPKIILDLGSNDYINGPTFTCTDIFLGYSLLLASVLGLFKPDSELGRYYKRLIDRPAFAGTLPSGNGN
jgi:glutathione S-transferase